MTTISSSAPSLTTNDSAVLQALFDAESSPSNSTSSAQIDPTLPPLPPRLNISPESHASLQSRELSIIQSLQSIPNPDIQTVHAAISDLSVLITEAPTYPPAYVNRAQAQRLLMETTESTSDARTAASALFSDLSTAISLSAPQEEGPVSSLQARVLADAYTHRGYLLLRAARARREETAGRQGLEPVPEPDALERVSADQLEEMASRDFFLGGRYGNEMARQLAVQTNPYAKMCGAIVKEAMRKEIEGVDL